MLNAACTFQDYWMGVNGTCDRFEVDYDSYWCQPNGRTGGATYCTRSPAAVTAMLPNMPYKGDTSGAVVTAWRGNGEWYTWQFHVDQYDPKTGNLTFGKGGFQGAEGSDAGGRWFIENVFEELDWCVKTNLLVSAANERHSLLWVLRPSSFPPCERCDWLALWPSCGHVWHASWGLHASSCCQVSAMPTVFDGLTACICDARLLSRTT